MKRITLDARKMNTRENAHEYLAKKCGFPDYYGKNLDAAYDCLTSMVDTEITVKHANMLEENLGEYGKTFLSVFSDAAANNTGLQVIFK
jgi:ribonuclease inhibitor